MNNTIFLESCQDTMARMDDDSLDLVVTSPPYFGCRKYSDGEELGREPDPREYVQNIVDITSDIKRVLKPTGTFYLNLGDCFFGTKGYSRNKGDRVRRADEHYAIPHEICKTDGKYIQNKQLLMLPSRVAIAMQDNGWVLRNDIIWSKSNPQPCISKDRRMPSFEHIFHFVKARKYYFNYELSKELKMNKDHFSCSVKPFRKHLAAFTRRIVEPLILVSSEPGDVVYDPFMGSGTTALIALEHGRQYIGSEVVPQYADICMENGLNVHNVNQR